LQRGHCLIRTASSSEHVCGSDVQGRRTFDVAYHLGFECGCLKQKSRFADRLCNSGDATRRPYVFPVGRESRAMLLQRLNGISRLQKLAQSRSMSGSELRLHAHLGIVRVHRSQLFSVFGCDCCELSVAQGSAIAGITSQEG
jgi:hypothetical protein